MEWHRDTSNFLDRKHKDREHHKSFMASMQPFFGPGDYDTFTATSQAMSTDEEDIDADDSFAYR